MMTEEQTQAFYDSMILKVFVKLNDQAAISEAIEVFCIAKLVPEIAMRNIEMGVSKVKRSEQITEMETAFKVTYSSKK